MVNFKFRSPKKELLDADDIPFEDIKKNMEELEIVNKYLGGHGITKKGLHNFLDHANKTLVICEIGCGGGDNLQALHQFSLKKKYSFPLNFISYGLSVNTQAFFWSQ